MASAEFPRVAIHTERVHLKAMSFWKPNIERRGRIIRGIMSIVLVAAAFIAHRKGIEWLAVILAISGIVGVVETVRGWCVLRACKIKTRF